MKTETIRLCLDRVGCSDLSVTDFLQKVRSYADRKITNLQLYTFLTQEQNSRTVTTIDIVIILCRAFVDLPPLQLTGKSGSLALDILWKESTKGNSVALERLTCQIAFLATLPDNPEALYDYPAVTYELHTTGTREWFSSPVKFGTNSFILHTSPMEEVPTHDGFVNFSNRRMQVHRFLASATQEEILFSVTPALQLCLLFLPELQDNQCVIVRNVTRVSRYSGYLDSFRWEGFVDNQLFTVLCMDACTSVHFSSNMLRRDVEKAYGAYSASACNQISTGNWGTGIFKGDSLCKFLLQLCAWETQESNRTLHFSTYGNQEQLQLYQRIYNLLQEKRVTVGSVMQWMALYGRKMEGKEKVSTFASWFETQVKKWDM